MAPLPAGSARRRKTCRPARRSCATFRRPVLPSAGGRSDRALDGSRSEHGDGAGASGAPGARDAGYGDAIGHEVVGIQRVLRAAGFESDIFVETADRGSST